MGSMLRHFPLLYNVDLIRSLDGGETVGNGDGGSSNLSGVQSILHHLLTLSVESRCGLVQQQDSWVPHQSPAKLVCH